MLHSRRVYLLQTILLWLGHGARVLGENCLRWLAFKAILLGFYHNAVVADDAGRPVNASTILQALFALLIVSALPAVVLMPVLDWLGRPDRARTTLAASTLVALVAVGACLVAGSGWLIGLAVIAASSAAYSTARLSLVPELARGAGVGIVAYRGCLFAFGILGVIGGIWLAETRLGPGPFYGVMDAAWLAFGAFAIAFLALLPLRFLPAGPPEPWANNIKLPDENDLDQWLWIARRRDSAYLLVGLAVGSLCLFGLVYVLIGSWVSAGYPARTLWVVGLGVLLGGLTILLQRNPYRIRGLAPLGMLGVFVCVMFGAANETWDFFLLWYFVGLTGISLGCSYQTSIPEAVQPDAFSLALGSGALITFLFASVWRYGTHPAPMGPTVLTVALLSATGALIYGWVYRRGVLECIVEVVLWPVYRVRATGPGFTTMPAHGPMLLIANHSAYLDPFWIAERVTRETVPMMTSRFYDMRLWKPVLKYIFRVIRVPDVPWRREAPELREAIAALDRGDCLVIFPEAYLRRKEEVPLRRFGQGIWQILKERPDTPVFVAWIEGGWGSYFSYKDGPPLHNKPRDFWRRIDIAFREGEIIPPETLESHLATRRYLMRRCLEARTLLGLPELETPIPGLTNNHAEEEGSANAEEAPEE